MSTQPVKYQAQISTSTGWTNVGSAVSSHLVVMANLDGPGGYRAQAALKGMEGAEFRIVEVPGMTAKLYRDTEGDLWATVPEPDRVFLAIAPDHVWEGPSTRTWESVLANYSPLTELTPDEAAKHRPALDRLITRLHIERPL